MDKKTLVVSFFGGPGTGKSTVASGVFSKLKWAKVNCENIPEYAKGITWQNSLDKLKNQIYVFAKQYNQIFHLLGKVDVILTDSPILLSLVYGSSEEHEMLRKLVIHEHHKLNNLNIFLRRVKDYNPAGRYQTFDEAKGLDVQIKEMLDQVDPIYHELVGEQASEELIKDLIIQRLSEPARHGIDAVEAINQMLTREIDKVQDDQN